jgi:hypothetical protein
MAFITDRSKIKSKIKPKAYKCLFVGYALNHSAHTYKFYNPITNKVIYSRDVVWADWDDVDPKRSIQAHRRTVVDELMKKPALSGQQKTALGDLLRHYVGSNYEEAITDEDWNIRRRYGRLADNTFELETGDHYGRNGRFIHPDGSRLLTTGGLHHSANPHLQGITEVTDQHGQDVFYGNCRICGIEGHRGSECPSRKQAPGEPEHVFYPGAYSQNVRPHFNDDAYEDTDEMPPLVQDEQTEEQTEQEVPEEERERELTAEEEVEEDETQEDEETVIPRKQQQKKKLHRELQNLDATYNPIRNTSREVRRLHTTYNPTAGNNEINVTEEGEQM